MTDLGWLALLAVMIVAMYIAGYRDGRRGR